MRRAPKLIAVVILALLWAACAAGCVSVPVPPSDMGNMKAGQLGRIEARVVVAYKPNWQGVAQAATDRLFKKDGYAK
jgi:hypothetical protein